MKPRLVSILIPAYNAERWINETIESAKCQTWPNKEIIIVDDGSSDRTYEIAKRHESGFVKVIRQDNRGASAARNKALSFAQGDYIQWLDADDLLETSKIAEQMKQVELEENARILFSGPFGIFYYRTSRARFIPTSLWRDLSPEEWLVLKFGNNLWVSPSVWLVSRKLTELAGPWDERLSLNDDGEYFCRVMCACEKVKFVPAAKSYYRHWSLGTLSWSSSYKACKSMFLSQKLCIGYLKSLENTERVRSACLSFLQTTYDYFYPEKVELMKEVNDLAYELGGTISPPVPSWEYLLVRRIFGSKMTKKAQQVKRKVTLSIHKSIDRILPAKI